MLNLLFLISLVSCSKNSIKEFQWPESTSAAVVTYVSIVEASYADSVSTGKEMTQRLNDLVNSPSQTNLIAARQAWLDAREPYLQTEVYRFYDGPIDHPDTGPEGLINAWPLDEAYIDYVDDDDTSGIINTQATIDAQTLASLNENGGEKNIATGYHAIEFLLWGQDLYNDSPGKRPYTDYLTNGAGTASNQDRRGAYLILVGNMLVGHLTQVHSQWVPNADYRVDFLANSHESFSKILTGMIILSGFETGGERLQAALDAGQQEEEHSCFSDNTHRDMIQNVQGVANVWTGSYQKGDGTMISGIGIKDVVAQVAPDLAGRLDAQINKSLFLAQAIKTPFDQEIVPGSEGNARIQALVESLRAQENLLFEVFTTFGLSITIPE